MTPLTVRASAKTGRPSKYSHRTAMLGRSVAILTLLLISGGAFAQNAPVITVLGDDPADVLQGMPYTDAGATALDADEGDLTGAIVTTGLPINTSAAGLQVDAVTYFVEDNEIPPQSDTQTRDVNVVFNNPPAITVLGANPVDVLQGAAYVDAGATASDTEDGNLTGAIITTGLPVDTSSVGPQLVTYTVTDNAGGTGKTTQVTRTVNVVANDPPVITILGDNPADVLQGMPYTDSGATASDNQDGNITGSINVTGLPVNTSTAGLQVGAVTYDVTDSDGNFVQVSRNVNVVFNNPPAITVLGANPVDVLQGAAYVDAGATASDTEDGNLTVAIITTGLPVDTSSVGPQLVTYTVTDNAGGTGKTTQVTRTVNVVANDPPVITILGDNPADVLQGAAYVDAGATAADNQDGNITGSINVSGLPVNTSTAGLQVGAVTYDVTDSDGNFVQVSRDVNVLSNTVPAITVLGDNPATVAEGGVYVDAGATALDAEDGNLTSSINTTGLPIDTSTAGLQVNAVTYDVTDSDGNFVQATRNIQVVGNSPPVLSAIGGQGVVEGDDLNIPLSATDPDGDTMVLSQQGMPSFCSFSDVGNGTGSINCSPLVGDGGAYPITVTVTDVTPTQKSDFEVFTLTVGANQAPTVSNVSISGTASVGELLTGSYTYNDAENDAEGTSTFRWLRDGAAIPGQTASTYTVVAADVGTNLAFEVTPVAATGASPGTPGVSANFPIANTPPVIDGQTANIETPEETPLEILLGTHVQASDAEGQTLTLTVSNSPDSPPSYSLSGNTITPTLDLNGVITIPVTVNDGFDDSDVFDVQITVTPVNDLPEFIGVAPPGLSTPEDTTLNIVLSDLIVSDPDSEANELSLALANPGPADNYTLAGATAITPATNFNGLLNVTASVSDGLGSSAPFSIPVDVTAENDLPVLVTEIASQQAVEDSPFSLDIKPNFSDDDVTDTLTYAVQWSPSKPPNIDFDTVNGVFSGTPRLVDAESPGPIYTVTVIASDLVGDVSDTFDLTVNALGRANLAMTIDIAPATASPTEELQWTFTTNNPVGPVAGENVQLTGSFVGEGITVTANGGVNCTLTVLAANDRTDFTCDIGQVTVGSNQQVRFTTSTSVATEIVAFATAAGAQPVPIDPNEEDNSDIAAAGVADAFSTLAVQDLGTASIASVAAGDLNGDGAADIVVGTASGQPVQVFFADVPRESCNCQRDFLSAPISIPDTGANAGVALADFDGNGTLDLVVANNGDQDDVVYGNDGNGNFSLMATLGPSNANDVAVGDFNNDGNMDVVVAASSPNLVYFGNGNGGFGNAVSLGNRDSLSVAVGRFDGNNRMDIAFANVGANSTVFVNSGGTSFTLRDQLNIGDAAAVAAGDLNGDGRDDLVFGRIASNATDIPSNPVLINPGNGNFGAPLALLGLSPTRDVLIGDINDDGSPDMVFISSSGVHQIWVAAGGSYALHSEQIMDLDAGRAVLANLGDTDDGDAGGPDLALGGRGNAGVGVWLNDSEGSLGLGDNVPPELTLNGEASVSVPANTSYVDAGATAVDNIDGDISSLIVVSNPVNLRIVGSYTVTYNVQDRAGNVAAQLSRNVNVTPNSGGGGGGGGGALSYWLLAFLLVVNIAGVVSLRRRNGSKRWIRLG